MRVINIDLSVVQRPKHHQFATAISGGSVHMTAAPFQVTAQCRVEVDPHYMPPSPPISPRSAPWKLGFMQVQILETQWAYYRGIESTHGCVLNDLAKHRIPGIVRDYEPSFRTVWYECSKNASDCYGLPTAGKSPQKLEFYFGDNPRQGNHAVVKNPLTNRLNYLHEARCAVAFITTLTELTSRDNKTGKETYKHHRHFSWSAIWHIQATNVRPDGSNMAFRLLPGSGFWVSPFMSGGSLGLPYLNVLNNSMLTTSANEVAKSAGVEQSVADRWQRFALMDQKDSLSKPMHDAGVR